MSRLALCVERYLACALALGPGLSSSKVTLVHVQGPGIAVRGIGARPGEAGVQGTEVDTSQRRQSALPLLLRLRGTALVFVYLVSMVHGRVLLRP
jgi:hypothetical protein